MKSWIKFITLFWEGISCFASVGEFYSVSLLFFQIFSKRGVENTKLNFAYSFRWIFLFAMLTTGTLSFAQMKKGDKLMQKKMWVDAAKAYEKEAKKTAPDKKVYQKLGEVYIKLKKYPEAEKAFQNAIEKNKLDHNKYLDYGRVLLLNGKVAFAKQSFNQYKMYARDDKAQKYLVTCDSIRKWGEVSPLTEVFTVGGGINTEESEFAPVKYEGGLLYTTPGKSHLVNEIEDESYKANYFDIYYANQSGNDRSAYEEGKLFSKKMTSDYHDGPANVTAKGDEIYFSQLKRTLGSEVMQLYIAKMENGKVKKVDDFFYNNDEYSFIHPAFSENGKMLFFSSNKVTGGKGGYDIYFCVKLRRFGWSIPKQVPGAINTKGNEVFPYFKNGKLYFSSDGHIGYGGLDIYQALLSEHYKVVYNMKEPMNTNADDFSLSFSDDSHGYFASNREGGMGQDDIYGFSILDIIEDKELLTMTGRFELNELPIENSTLVLMDENGVEMARVKTDEYGDFEFQHLDPDRSYSIRPIELVDGSDIFITNASGEKVMLLTENKDFSYKTLKAELVDGLSTIALDDPDLLKGPVNGFVYQNLKGDYSARVEVIAYDDDGNMIEKTHTDKDGNFVFEKLDPDKTYLIKLAESDADLQMEILAKAAFGQFNLTPLEAEKAETLMPIEVNDPTFITIPLHGMVYETLAGDYSERIEVIAYDDDGDILGRTYLKEDGSFDFKNLPPQDVYIVKLAADDTELNLSIYDDLTGEMVTAEADGDNNFSYHRIDEMSDYIRLINEEGVILKIRQGETFTASRIYYASNSSDLNADAQLELGKLVLLFSRNFHINVLLSSHTDTKGDAKYNLKLSEKRAKAGVKYLEKKGIPKEKLKGKGYGETKPLIKDREIAKYTSKIKKDRAHALNRRTDITISGKTIEF